MTLWPYTYICLWVEFHLHIGNPLYVLPIWTLCTTIKFCMFSPNTNARNSTKCLLRWFMFAFAVKLHSMIDRFEYFDENENAWVSTPLTSMFFVCFRSFWFVHVVNDAFDNIFFLKFHLRQRATCVRGFHESLYSAHEFDESKVFNRFWTVEFSIVSLSSVAQKTWSLRDARRANEIEIV